MGFICIKGIPATRAQEAHLRLQNNPLDGGGSYDVFYPPRTSLAFYAAVSENLIQGNPDFVAFSFNKPDPGNANTFVNLRFQTSELSPAAGRGAETAARSAAVGALQAAREVTAYPELVSFGVLRPQQTRTLDIHLLGSTPNGLKEARVTAGASWLSARLVPPHDPASPSPVPGESASHILEVKLLPGAPLGAFRSHIRITLASYAWCDSPRSIPFCSTTEN
jgi:hypothetical protein